MNQCEPTQCPGLHESPLIELVCGVHYAPTKLDGAVIGVFWDGRKDQYPEQSLQTAVVDGASLSINGIRIRGVFVSYDRSNYLQIQHDRFHVNRRAVGGVPPRFTGHSVADSVMVTCIDEFDRIDKFCEARF